MQFEIKSIADQIDCLARLTGAPQSFVLQVKLLFSRKGIPLNSDATPYVKALEEAFKREENIRTTAQRARQNIRKLQSNFNKIGNAYVRQLEELKRLRTGSSGKKKSKTASADSDNSVVIPDGDHRTLVTPPQRETLPMVPGPEEDQ
jgi:mannitol-1-phosphate/altronate dehydrogenase